MKEKDEEKPKITDTYLSSLKAAKEAQNIPCGDGLFLRISPKVRSGGNIHPLERIKENYE